VHVVEDGVFDRVMQYELGKAKAYMAEKQAKRRTRADSNAKSTKASSVGSDDCEYDQPTNLTTDIVRERESTSY
jgi:hypothetical protein